MRPLLIGHRGASGHRPEHTLAAYALAARMGADAIEPDLVATCDGVLVARHEPEIGGTTDVASRPAFASRRTVKELGGEPVEGWFCEDFTLTELKTLRCRERLPELRGTALDGVDPVATLDEILALRASLSVELGREIVVYPETKHPARSRALGLPLEEPLVAALRAHGLDGPGAPVFVQSFERDSLERVGAALPVRRTRLVAAANPGGVRLRTPYASSEAQTPGLEEIFGHAEAVGPAKELLLPRDAEGRSLPPTRFVEEAHGAGLLVHPWTFRAENAFLPAELRRGDEPAAYGDLAAELRAVLALGVDGLFCDHPDVAAAVLNA
ncbi:MAG: glycerophosphodiester phosphodiesterase [Solirubrobacterales bacterium]|nr:glycerophosphodiester phosphodiesterase [Solirubrobacterales bacterium]